MFSYWAYVLIGNDKTGKTSFQRNLVSHLCGKRYTRLPKRRYYNVAGIFLSNAVDKEAREIALLPWSEVLWIENPELSGEGRIAAQLDGIAKDFSEFLIARASV